MRTLKAVSPLLAAIALTACAAPGAESLAEATPTTKQCFQNDQVRSFSDAGPGVALVSIGASEAWELTLSPGCPSVGSANKIGIVSRGRNRICSGSDAELIVPTASGSSSQRCLVRSVRKLSPQETAEVRGATPR